MGAHAALSAALFVWLLPDPPSIAFGLAFAFAPFVIVRLLGASRAALVVVLLQTLAVLWLRRYGLMIPGLADFGPVDHTLSVIGASYIVLRQIQWVLWRDGRPDEPHDLVAYTAFLLGGFTLLAGPIVAYEQWRDGFRAEDDRLEPDVVLRASHRIVRGYLSAAVLAPILGAVSSLEAVDEAGWSLGARALSVYAYPLFIYFNFAGYCDVVIGLAALAGQRLPENFDKPFAATNVQDFWQRWHITFGDWARDHVGYPLQLSLRRRRVPSGRVLVVSVLAVFLFVGLWHGAEWGFFLFGLLHGLAVLALPLWKRLQPRLLGERGRTWLQDSRGGFALRWLLCFHFLCATIALFNRTPSEALRLLIGG